MRKLGIYVQVPFCQTKCTYCNFHTGVVASSRFAPYVEAVCGEIRGHRELLGAAGVGSGVGFAGQAHSQDSSRDRREMENRGLCHEAAVDTVYIGGGAPRVLEATKLPDKFGGIWGTVKFGSRGDGPGGRENSGET